MVSPMLQAKSGLLGSPTSPSWVLSKFESEEARSGCLEVSNGLVSVADPSGTKPTCLVPYILSL